MSLYLNGEYADTPRPERVTLTAEEGDGGAELAAKWRKASAAARAFEHHFPADCLAEAAEYAESAAAREQALREEERAAWSAWLDACIGAVGPNAPTVESVADALRSGPRPFGIARGETR